MKEKNHVMRAALAAGVGWMLGLLQACAPSDARRSSEYRTLAKDPGRDTGLAARDNARGIELMRGGHYGEAEAAFKAALAADITHGPAHNNLGKVYFHQSKFYLAAWEFQYASKLMPNHPEPRNNIGLVFEEVGKLDDAVLWYDKATQLEPDNPLLVGNLVRARVRRGDQDAEVRELLSKVIATDTRPEWVAWARERLALLRPYATE